MQPVLDLFHQFLWWERNYYRNQNWCIASLITFASSKSPWFFVWWGWSLLPKALRYWNPFFSYSGRSAQKKKALVNSRDSGSLKSSIPVFLTLKRGDFCCRTNVDWCHPEIGWESITPCHPSQLACEAVAFVLASPRGSPQAMNVEIHGVVVVVVVVVVVASACSFAAGGRGGGCNLAGVLAFGAGGACGCGAGAGTFVCWKKHEDIGFVFQNGWCWMVVNGDGWRWMVLDRQC